MSDDKKFPPMMTKEAFESLYKSEDGWSTVYEGPTLRIPNFEKFEGVREIMRQTEEAGGYQKEFSESLVTEDDGLTGSDSIREGIDAEILQMMNKSLVEEEAAIIDDLKRQMEAKIPQLLDQATHCQKCGSDIHISSTLVSCTKCTWFYVPLQVSNIFNKKEDKAPL